MAQSIGFDSKFSQKAMMLGQRLQHAAVVETADVCGVFAGVQMSSSNVPRVSLIMSPPSFGVHTCSLRGSCWKLG